MEVIVVLVVIVVHVCEKSMVRRSEGEETGRRQRVGM